ncbi:MAG: ATP-dependent Clp protease adapter ClpS [Nitrospinae bacterium]|jgi:ATP-dependent Clp protease adaptor protein ClpS|nr:ATP-dependent Clp protease adapter ClpS [Nitrospinota bacterium]MDP7580671.1 ATP-dependent Clp protease adapter ClpS [Nitrospinota bacterium]HJN02064.1 ATP-dependent Clp protease adapter ClpS [Nitrospinota bacterium]
MAVDEQSFEENVLTKKREKVEKPPLYRVVLHNDNYTTMEFVVLVLQKFFYKNETEANHIMLNVHKKGRGIAGIFTFEVAETKLSQVHSFAKNQDHPLKCSLEPDK